ncbi:MAG: hypothetical protein MK185_04615 [Saccharospirillaceae bacterium]|nr:hypothetical protein A3759_15180 [Thalassolituus sp. HI0120]MCH2039891.1 hypothetical protein [Saccharospirillaceae bacterium]
MDGTAKFGLVKFPNKLCIYSPEYREHCILNLELIRVLAGQRELIWIDLSLVQEITASGALALFAQITSVKINEALKADIHIIGPKNVGAKRLFLRSGLTKAIEVNDKKQLEKLWKSDSKFQSGFNPDKHLEPTLEKIENTIRLPYKLKEAIQEAVLNIKQHAYSEAPGVVPRWWHYAYTDHSNNRFVFAICDRGISIPGKLSALQLSDADAIEEAMKQGVSSTGDPWRGKGSNDIKKPIQTAQTDKLLVLSRLGLYEYNLDAIPVKKTILKNQFNGTLIAWDFTIE